MVTWSSDIYINCSSPKTCNCNCIIAAYPQYIYIYIQPARRESSYHTQTHTQHTHLETQIVRATIEAIIGDQKSMCIGPIYTIYIPYIPCLYTLDIQIYIHVFRTRNPTHLCVFFCKAHRVLFQAKKIPIPYTPPYTHPQTLPHTLPHPYTQDIYLQIYYTYIRRAENQRS